MAAPRRLWSASLHRTMRPPAPRSTAPALCAARGLWSTSLKDSVRSQSPGLCLSASEELLCGDPVCMRFGDLCLCRLSMQLERLKHVRHLDLRHARLDRLPEVM